MTPFSHILLLSLILCQLCTHHIQVALAMQPNQRGYGQSSLSPSPNDAILLQQQSLLHQQQQQYTATHAPSAPTLESTYAPTADAHLYASPAPAAAAADTAPVIPDLHSSSSSPSSSPSSLPIGIPYANEGLTMSSLLQTEADLGQTPLSSIPKADIDYTFTRGTDQPMGRGVVLSDGEAPHTGLGAFTGSADSYIDLMPQTFGGTGLTLRFWVKFTGEAGQSQHWSRLIDCGVGAGNSNLLFARYWITNDLILGVMNGPSWAQLQASNVIVKDQWMDIVVTISSSGYAIMYINGGVAASGQTQPVVKVTRTNCYVARSNWGWWDPNLQAVMDRFQFWTSTTLSFQQVKTLYTEDVKTPCQKNYCDSKTKCTDNPTNIYATPKCGPCPDGYRDVGNNGRTICQDINECTISQRNPCQFDVKCTNTDGSYVCDKCPKGYSGDAKAGTCNDVDECLINPNSCDPLSKCINTVGSFTCGDCPAGYRGDPKIKCQDIDECLNNNGGCDKTTKCTNSPGSRTCGPCPDGFKGDGYSICQDIDECSANNGGCDPRTVCSNTPGSRTCSDCPKGYQGNGATGCQDFNECLINNGGCDSKAQCKNTEGSRECGSCPPGYRGDGSSGCYDIDECEDENGGCDPVTKCINQPGTRSCSECPPGYRGNGLTGCLDKDECLENNGGCDILTNCINTPGSRACGACPRYYKGSGENGCRMVNMCTVIANGGCDSRTTCTPNVNAKGGRLCGKCPPGMLGDGYTGCREDTRFQDALAAEKAQDDSLRDVYNSAKPKLTPDIAVAGLSTVKPQVSNSTTAMLDSILAKINPSSLMQPSTVQSLINSVVGASVDQIRTDVTSAVTNALSQASMRGQSALETATLQSQTPGSPALNPTSSRLVALGQRLASIESKLVDLNSVPSVETDHTSFHRAEGPIPATEVKKYLQI